MARELVVNQGAPFVATLLLVVRPGCSRDANWWILKCLETALELVNPRNVLQKATELSYPRFSFTALTSELQLE